MITGRHVFTMDLQAVKLCPNVNASAICYKQRLQAHNFTIYNLTTHRYEKWSDELHEKIEKFKDKDGLILSFCKNMWETYIPAAF